MASLFSINVSDPRSDSERKSDGLFEELYPKIGQVLEPIWSQGGTVTLDESMVVELQRLAADMAIIAVGRLCPNELGHTASRYASNLTPSTTVARSPRAAYSGTRTADGYKSLAAARSAQWVDPKQEERDLARAGLQAAGVMAERSSDYSKTQMDQWVSDHMNVPSVALAVARRQAASGMRG